MANSLGTNGVRCNDGSLSLRKHTYSNILKISQTKTELFNIKILIFFHISAQNMDCGTR